MKKAILIFLVVVGSFVAPAQNQKPATPATPLLYGPSVTLDQAEKMMVAAIQEATKNGWLMAVAIVDTGGNLVAFRRMDNTQIGSIDVAIGKATTANNFKRPTKALEDALANGGNGLRILSIPGATPLEGGEPILLNGKVIGGIGVSGMQSGQDEQVTKAGLAALN